MSRTVTVRVTESRGGAAERAYGSYWLPFSWIAFHGGKIIATGVDRATRAETIHDISLLFAGWDDVEVTVEETIDRTRCEWALRSQVVPW